MGWSDKEMRGEERRESRHKILESCPQLGYEVPEGNICRGDNVQVRKI